MPDVLGVTVPVSPLSWYGGKARLSEHIVRLLPRHDTYVEPFAGAASVLFRKEPCTLEVYNDVDDGLVTFFRVLRDRPLELARLLRLTPYARAEFERCRDSWETCEDELERARRWFVRARMGFAGSAATKGWAFELNGSKRGGSHSGSFTAVVDMLESFSERLRRVQVEQLDWRRCLERYDETPGVVFYLDPPYHPEARGRKRQQAYRHELECGDHDDLLARVTDLRGSVLLSGYPHPLYDAELADAGFERFEFQTMATASRVLAGRGPRTEVLWRRLAHGSQESIPGQLWAAR